MKKIILGFSVLLSVALFSFKVNSAETVNDDSQSSIKWVGKKVTGQHEGTIDFKSVEINYDSDGDLVGMSFVVDMNSIKCTDLDGEYGDKLVGHLKSEDFFGVSKYSEASFIATKVVNQKDGNYMITGDIKIKEKTESITFEADLKKDGMMVTGNANVILDRSKFDVRYGSGSFFDGLGDNMIYDDFELEISIKEKLN